MFLAVMISFFADEILPSIASFNFLKQRTSHMKQEVFLTESNKSIATDHSMFAQLYIQIMLTLR